MGLISWIKNKYYDHRLSSADKLVENNNFDKAQLIYESLLGKQSVAEAHLAKMLVDNASGVNDKIDVLKRLEELKQYSTDISLSEFTSVLNQHVSSIETLAANRFTSRGYDEAVSLLSSIGGYRNGVSYTDKLSRYKAHQSFNRENQRSIGSVDYKDVVSLLSQISSVPVSDIKDMLKTLAAGNRYARGIILLLQLQNVGSWVKDTILKYVVEIVSGNDSEKKNISSLKDFCSDSSVCRDAAVNLAKRAKEKARGKDFKTAVLYDQYAAEYLSDDNSFNYERCSHVLDELAQRTDAKEIKKLLDLSASLKLSEQQASKLLTRINEIAVVAIPAKGLAICKLFIGRPDFNKIYLEKALSLAKAGEHLDLDELRKVIGQQSNPTTLPDVLAPFVCYLPAFENEFVSTAITAIYASKSTDLLDKYWKVKPDSRFIKQLATISFDACREMAIHVTGNPDIFLDRPLFLSDFCEILKSNDELDFALDRLEELLKATKNVQEFYVSFVLNNARNFRDLGKSIDLVNRALTHLSNDRLITEKKKYISGLIAEEKFERAEKEIKSLIGKDDEAATLLAELYYNQAKASSSDSEQVSYLEKVLSVDEQYSLHDRFLDCLQDTLSRLSVIAKRYAKEGKSEEAFGIAERIKSYWGHWIPLYAWLRNETKADNQTLGASVKYDAETISEIVKVSTSAKDYESEEYVELWSRFYDNNLKRSQSQPKDKAVASLSKLRKLISSYAPVSFRTAKTEELSKILVRLKWELATEFEHDHCYAEAATLYDEIVGDSVQQYINRAELRSLICSVKSDSVDVAVEERIDKALQIRSFEVLREDLAYRYAHYLLKQTRPSEAENILKTYLPDEKGLLALCENIFIKEAEQKLSEFNAKVKKLNDGKMSVAEATQFKSDLRTYKKEITGRLTDLGRPFGQISPKIEAYILAKMFEEEAYLELLQKLMQENPNYIENDIDFRNIAIASLGIIESDCDDEPTVKRAIATCLTAIYSDRLFVQSLDYTSRDDKYTFTLDGSLGNTKYDNYDELPDNVNFDTPIDNVNVAIKDVQNSLLTRVEAAVRKYHPSLEKFCNDEKDALSKLIELRLDKAYILASPHLCRTLSSLRMSIGNAFEYELGQDYGNREEVIALGVDYGFSDGEYGQYKNAYNALLFCKSALSSSPYGTVSSAFQSTNIMKIKRYNRLISDLKSTIGTAMNEDIRNNMAFKSFLDKYEPVCKAVNDTTIALTCSNYVNGEVVHLLNEDKMQLREGVGYLVRLYNIAPSHEQVKNNLEGVLNNLAHKAEKDNLTSDRNALQKALRDLNGKFDDAISLSVIIAKLSNKRMEPYTALSQLYNLYQKKKTDPEVCDALAAVAKLCIHKYIIGDTYTGKSQVRATLNQLQNNRSSVFKEKAKILAAEYLEIFKQLPQDAQILMMGGLSLGMQTLNSKGQALKEGLDYFKNLSDLDQLLRRH